MRIVEHLREREWATVLGYLRFVSPAIQGCSDR